MDYIKAPWVTTTNEYPTRVTTLDGSPVATVAEGIIPDGAYDEAMVEARARLIADAPRLSSDLQRALAQMESYERTLQLIRDALTEVLVDEPHDLVFEVRRLCGEMGSKSA